jgi:hypothetical protein
MKWTAIVLAVAACVGSSPAIAKPSDAQIKERIVQESIDSYPGNCPCPYNTDRAGRSCGRRSAYSRPGGYSPKCYPADVTAAEVKAYKARNQ